jgi:hypothetical protein
MPVTADSTPWTADTTYVTADGRIIRIDAYVAEPNISVSADTTLYTADNTTWPTADGGTIAVGGTDALDAVRVAGGAVIAADVVEAAEAAEAADAVGSVFVNAIEPAAALDQLDAAVGGNVFFADVVEAAGALDSLDAAVVPEIVAVPGGAHYPRRRPLPVVGRGHGILPRLWGEAHGVVGVVAKGAAQLLVHATAVGASVQVGAAAATIKGLSVAGKGAVGVRGAGEGMIVKFSGTATGQHDDDEAAVIAFLLAA